MAKIFDDIKTSAGDIARSYTWYQSKIRSMGGSSVTSNNLMKDRENLTSTLMPGNMYLFYYDPKHKETLPYYDSFPLVLPFRRVPDGFFGINLHYLPYLLRFRILQALDEIADKRNETDRISLSWRLLNSTANLRPATACVKHYLTKHLRSRFLYIDRNDWITASQLPVEDFNKASKKQVWADTIGKF